MITNSWNHALVLLKSSTYRTRELSL